MVHQVLQMIKKVFFSINQTELVAGKNVGNTFQTVIEHSKIGIDPFTDFDPGLILVLLGIIAPLLDMLIGLILNDDVAGIVDFVTIPHRVGVTSDVYPDRAIIGLLGILGLLIVMLEFGANTLVNIICDKNILELELSL